jgi:predicted dehydrogenase
MIKIGVLGAGYLGKIHILQLKEIKGIEITGFYDPNNIVSEKVEDEYNLKAFSSEDELISTSGAILIAASTTEHFKLAKKCMLSGKHVFIEKPLSETIEQAEELLQIAQGQNLKVQIGHVERFNPAMLEAKKFGLNPMFIETHRLAEFNPRGTDVSVILDLLIHDIDITLSIVKSKVVAIHASGVSIVSNQPDIANARIEFENGCVANLTASRLSLRKERKMRIFQQDAYILIDFLNKIAERLSINGLDTELNPFSFIIDNGTEKKIVKMDKPVVLPGNAIRAELEAFFQAIRNNTNTPVTLQDGYNSLKVAFEIINQIKDKENKLKTAEVKAKVAQ